MIILEAVKKAEEKQKTLSINTAKVYIRRKGWTNLINPVDFGWTSGENTATPFKESDNSYAPNKESLLANDWELFTHYFDLSTKDKTQEKENVNENITDILNQIAKIKKLLVNFEEDTTDIKALFEKNYGINYNYFVKNPTILKDREDACLYFFAELATANINKINNNLNEIIAKLSGMRNAEKTE